MRAPLPASFLLCLTALVAGCVNPTSGEEGMAPAATEAATPLLSEAEVSGTVAGPHVVLFSMNAQEILLSVPEGATDLVISLAAEGGAAQGYVFDPECDAIECATALSTQSAPDAAFAQPLAGEWTVHVAKGEPGASPVSYTLHAQALLPAGLALELSEPRPAEG